MLIKPNLKKVVIPTLKNVDFEHFEKGEFSRFEISKLIFRASALTFHLYAYTL